MSRSAAAAASNGPPLARLLRALEDDAERPVRAALELTGAVDRQQAPGRQRPLGSALQPGW